MQSRYVDPIIKTLSKKIGKLISDEQLKSLQKEVLGSEFDIKKFYKLIFVLKQRQYLIPLRKDLYIISYPENREFRLSSVIEKLYRELLHKQITSHCKSLYYIGSLKGLELHLGNYDITNEIDIYNTTHTGSEQIVSDYNALYKLYPDPKNSYHSKAKSCFTISKAHRQKIAIGKHEFFIGPIEVCTLESLYYTDVSTSTYQAELIKRVIKKHKTTRDWDIIKQVIGSGKHHTSLNRLLQLSKSVDQEFSKMCDHIIKTIGFKTSK